MELANVTMRPLSIMFERLWQTEEVSEDWKKANITPSSRRDKRSMKTTTGWSYLTNMRAFFNKITSSVDEGKAMLFFILTLTKLSILPLTVFS